MAKSRSLWVAFSSDSLELPFVVADTSRELARYLGVSENYVLKKVYQKLSGEKCGYKVERIDVGLEWRERNGL